MKIIFLLAFSTIGFSSTNIKCELTNFGTNQNSTKYLLIHSAKNEKFDVAINAIVTINQRSIAKNINQNPSDYFSSIINSPNELQLKLVKSHEGQNIRKKILVDRHLRRGHYIDNGARYTLENCEID